MKHRIVLALTLVVAIAVGVAAPSPAETVTAPLSGGLLTLTTTPTVFAQAVLTGANTTLTASPLLPWAVTDARGTGAVWEATISSTNLVGTLSPTNVMPVSSLKVSTGGVTAALGSDPITNILGAANLTLSGTAQTLINTTGTSKGSYTFSPAFTLSVPANVKADTYVATLTLTIT